MKTFEENYLDVLRWTIGNPTQTCRWPFRSPLGAITREPDFSRTCGFRRKLRNIMFFHFKQKKVHINGLDFQQNCKNPILGLIWPLFAQKRGNRIFPEKSGFVTFLHLWIPNIMQKIRKILWPNFEKKLGQTDGETERQEQIHRSLAFSAGDQK